MKTENWLSPMNRVILLKAFRKRNTSVILRDGRRFTMEYSTKSSFDDEFVDVVWVAPEIGFAPCGWFRMDRVTDRLWITESSIDTPDSVYEQCLDQFVESTGLIGIDVVEQWPSLEGKLSTTLQRGFSSAKSARGKRAGHVVVLHQENKVYLVKEQQDGSDE